MDATRSFLNAKVLLNLSSPSESSSCLPHGGGLRRSETWMRQNQAVVSVTFQSEACQATPVKFSSGGICNLTNGHRTYTIVRFVHTESFKLYA
ncbi:hypothetical protein YC2023_010986 [Brassica napus]